MKIATYNIHKGMSVFNRRHVLPGIKRALKVLDADLVFLQEVQGEHHGRSARFSDWPSSPQHMELADGQHHAYGRNAEYETGHHGNALISRYPILYSHNVDISVNRLEQRGLLHGRIAVPDWPHALDVLCVHLNLRAPDRRRQLDVVAAYVRAHVADDAPLILAGDFNDWRREACAQLHDTLGMRDAFQSRHGTLAATFPARLPVLALDRIYVRGFEVESASVHRDGHGMPLSDHVPLCAVLKPAGCRT